MYTYVGACFVIVIVAGNEHSDLSSNQDEAVSISLSANNLGKGVNLTILAPLVGKYEGRMGSLTLVRRAFVGTDNAIKLRWKI